MGEMGPFLWTGSMRNEVRVPLLLPVIPRLAAVDTSLSWTLSRLPRGGRWGEASRVPGMDSCSEAGMTVEPRRARARWYPEGDMGRGLSRVPGMDSCSKAGMTVEPRRARARWYPEGGYGAGPLPRPRDGFLLKGRNDGGTTSCPRTLVPRGGIWGGASPASQGWIPAQRQE